ncbi:MAG: efflux RND transporter periplasmic adaptor subunit [Bacteroidales bacterium]|nr:efflux RND transporter periplasmic adaptor subunit [Bacteroidales bacterium]
MKKISIVIIGLGLIMLASCKGNEKKAVLADEKPKVKLTKVTGQDIPQTEVYSGTVESDVKNNISPNMQVRIQKIYCDVGDYVRRGQVVVALDASSQQQMKLQIQSQITQTKSQLAQMQNQQAEFNRTAELYKIGGASKSEYDAAQTQLTVQQNAVAAQESQLKVLQTQLAQLNQNTNLTSPISGVVTARNYDDGDMYNGTPVLTIEQLNPVKLKVNISESHFKDVTIGMPVRIDLDAYVGEEFAGKVSTIYPTIDQNTHTFPVEITVVNSDNKVRPGMFGRASIDFGTEYHVLVPDIALVKQVGAGDRYVYVYKNGKVSYQKVELGQHIGENYEIKSGVEPDDQVVIAGMSRLANGKEVEVVK